MIVSCNLARASLFRLKYPDNLPGLSLSPLRYPANLAGIPDALIFFCLLFFHQGKALCRGQGSLPGTFFERMIVSCNLARASLFRLKYPDNLPGLSLSPLRYPANLAGIPDALIFFCLLFFHQGKALCRGQGSLPGTFFERMIVSRNFPGLGDALIFFCLLFFHQGKKRRKRSLHFAHQEKKRRKDPSNSNTVSPI